MKDLFPAQRFAGDVSPMTTVDYTHPSDDELYAKIERLPQRVPSPTSTHARAKSPGDLAET